MMSRIEAAYDSNGSCRYQYRTRVSLKSSATTYATSPAAELGLGRKVVAGSWHSAVGTHAGRWEPLLGGQLQWVDSCLGSHAPVVVAAVRIGGIGGCGSTKKKAGN